MKVLNDVDDPCRESEAAAAADVGDLLPLVAGRERSRPVPSGGIAGAVVGELVAIIDDGRTPLVLVPGRPSRAAVAARSVVDLHGAHIGKAVVLMFEGGDPDKPVLLGVVRDGGSPSLDARPGTVDVDADGERLVVTAKQQLVLRCGKASITLTAAGKVLIQGDYVSSSSSGTMRIRGGSVHIN